MPDLDSLSAYLSRLVDFETLTMFVLWSAIGLVLRKPLGKLSKLKGWQLFWVIGSISLILSFTIRLFNLEGSDPTPWLLNWVGWSQAFSIATNWYLNLLLFIPAGLVLILVGKKTIRAILGLVLLSALIETIQQLTWSGVADPADFVANSIGAAVGIGIGVFWRMLAKNS